MFAVTIPLPFGYWIKNCGGNHHQAQRNRPWSGTHKTRGDVQETHWGVTLRQTKEYDLARRSQRSPQSCSLEDWHWYSSRNDQILHIEKSFHIKWQIRFHDSFARDINDNRLKIISKTRILHTCCRDFYDGTVTTCFNGVRPGQRIFWMQGEYSTID